jgi:hypothetical protein
MAAVTLARLALLVALYVSLDVSNPMMPGALGFGIEESVDVVQSDRFRGQDHAALVPPAPEPRRLDPPDRSATALRPAAPGTPRVRQAHVTRSQPSSPAPASPSDDH